MAQLEDIVETIAVLVARRGSGHRAHAQVPDRLREAAGPRDLRKRVETHVRDSPLARLQRAGGHDLVVDIRRAIERQRERVRTDTPRQNPDFAAREGCREQEREEPQWRNRTAGALLRYDDP